ncbi:MAG: SDR family NAD(P)-dependent oxidoreductase [Clostridiaceae bacterium]|nr:SDR family NAD(P)-dependent oxidoreductase [Clostridiaceae bacterium]
MNSKIAVITGASGGIGAAAAARFADAGYAVYGLSRHPGADPRIRFIPCDVARDSDVCAAFDAIREAAGSIDVLVCNAGMGISGAAAYASDADIARIFGVNCFGVFRCIREARALCHAGSQIVIVTSAAAVFAIPFQAYYSATKSALNSYTLALRTELAVAGIRVSAVMPGDVRTGFTDARVKSTSGTELYGDRIEKSVAAMERDERHGMSPDAVARVIFRQIHAKNPRPLVTVGGSYKLFIFLNRILPTRLVAFLIGKMYS